MALALIFMLMIPVFVGYLLVALFIPLLGLFVVGTIAAAGLSKMIKAARLILVTDDGSPLVDLSEASPEFVSQLTHVPHILVRAEVLRRLIEAQRRVPKGMHLRVDLGYQDRAKTAEGTDDACFVGQDTGGDIQVHMVYISDDSDVDLGPLYFSRSTQDPACATASTDITLFQRKHRHEMARALGSAGFVNDPSQWWHWSYGDIAWAKRSRLSKRAIFGPIQSQNADA